MKKVNDYNAYLSLVEKYNQKNCYSNDYIQKEVEDLIVAQRLYSDEYTDNLFFFVDKGIGKRVYYYINNLTEFADFSQYKDLLVEILFRGEAPGQLVDYFSHCGFRVNLIRDQYAAMYKDEGYGIYKYGYIEDLEKINLEDISAHYKKLISEAKIY